jgi:glycosyltransferase involved in cell wall biosynthesis
LAEYQRVPSEKNLEKQISLANLSSEISLPGQKENASRFLKAFDIFVLPSRKEGMPFALLEAMQAGLPIIATNVGGVPEVVGESGVLVEANNSEELSRALFSTIQDSAKRKELASKAKNRAEQFSLNATLLETEGIYRKILKA